MSVLMLAFRSQVAQEDRPEPSSKNQRRVQVIDTPEFVPDEKSGDQQIYEYVEPVWKYTDKQLVDLLASRIVHDDGNFYGLHLYIIMFLLSEELIAFDKPYQLAYSGAVKKSIQMDKILQVSWFILLFEFITLYFRALNKL